MTGGLTLYVKGKQRQVYYLKPGTEMDLWSPGNKAKNLPECCCGEGNKEILLLPETSHSLVQPSRFLGPSGDRRSYCQREETGGEREK